MMNQAEILELCHMKKLPFEMRKRQLEAINSFVDGNNVALFLPTGYGKTLPAKLAAKYLWETQGKKTILIGLLKALTEEQFGEFQEIMPTLIDDSDHRKKLAEYEEEEWGIACMTPEKFDVIMNSAKKREVVMQDVGLIITDEAHTIGDASRGHRMENYLITTRIAYPELKYMFLSATVGNPHHFADWLESELIFAEPSERPVPLELKINTYEEITVSWADYPDHKKNFDLRMRMLRSLMRQYKDKNWIIFTTSRLRTIQVANALVNDRKRHTLEELVEEHSIGYHNAGLSKAERHYVEDSFRDGTIKVVCATPTLAVGVNLPADCCVLFDVEQYSAINGSEPLEANRIQQTIGRAGRPNLSDMGYAFIFVPERLEEVITDRALNPLVVESKLKPRLHEKILQWIASGLASDKMDIMELAAGSYAEISDAEADKAVEWLTMFDFLKKTEYGLAITKIGRLTVAMYVMPETVVAWKGQICNIVDSTDLTELFVRFGTVAEYYDVVTARKEDETIMDYASHDLGEVFPPMKRHCNNLPCSTCASISNCNIQNAEMTECDEYIRLVDWRIEKQLLKCYFLTFNEDLIKKYEITKKIYLSTGDKMLLKENGFRMFNAASVIFSSNKTLSSSLGILSLMCQAGTLRTELIELCKLKKIGLKRAELLYKAGFNSIGDVLNGDPVKVARALRLSTRVVKNLIMINKKEFK